MIYYKGFKPFFSRPKFAPGIKATKAQKDFWLPKQYTDAAKERYVPPKVCGLAFRGWSHHPLPQPKYYSIPQPKRYFGTRVHRPTFASTMFRPKRPRFR